MTYDNLRKDLKKIRNTALEAFIDKGFKEI